MKNVTERKSRSTIHFVKKGKLIDRFDLIEIVSGKLSSFIVKNFSNFDFCPGYLDF